MVCFILSWQLFDGIRWYYSLITYNVEVSSMAKQTNTPNNPDDSRGQRVQALPGALNRTH